MSIYIRGLGVHEPLERLVIDAIKEREQLAQGYLDYLGVDEITVSAELMPTDMAVLAGKAAMRDAGLSPTDVDGVVYTNAAVPEYYCWPDYAHVQQALGLSGFAVKIDTACASAMVGLEYAFNKLIARDDVQNILIASGERYDPQITDRLRAAQSCFYGDGGSAMLVSRQGDFRVLDVLTHSEGKYSELHGIPAGGQASPATVEDVAAGRLRFEPAQTARTRLETPELRQQFWNEITEISGHLVERLLNRNGCTSADIEWLACYNMGREVVRALAHICGVPLKRSTWQFSRTHGHIGSTDMALNLYLLRQAGHLRIGDLILLLTCGTGFSWGLALLRYEGR